MFCDFALTIPSRYWLLRNKVIPDCKMFSIWLSGGDSLYSTIYLIYLTISSTELLQYIALSFHIFFCQSFPAIICLLTTFLQAHDASQSSEYNYAVIMCSIPQPTGHMRQHSLFLEDWLDIILAIARFWHILSMWKGCQYSLSQRVYPLWSISQIAKSLLVCKIGCTSLLIGVVGTIAFSINSL